MSVLVQICTSAVTSVEEDLKWVAKCRGQLTRVFARMMVTYCTTLLRSQFDPILLKDCYRPRRVPASAYLMAIEGRLAQVVEQSNDYQTLTRETENVTLKHSVENLKTMHHEAMLTVMMPMALSRCQVVAGLDELNH